MKEKREIQEINFENDYLLLKLDGHLFKISPSGDGIHWPLIDEDISISALLKEVAC